MSFKLDFVYYKKSSSERAPPPHFSGECRFKITREEPSEEQIQTWCVQLEVRLLLSDMQIGVVCADTAEQASSTLLYQERLLSPYYFEVLRNISFYGYRMFNHSPGALK